MTKSKQLEIFNPATEERLATLECDQSATIQKKFQQVHEGQIHWAKTSLEERLLCLKRFFTALQENEAELARTLTLEMGKPLAESRNEIKGARERIAFFLEESKRILSPQIVRENPGLRETIAFEPLGVIGYISAWNYPYLIAMNVVVPALIGGNSVLYKPSEYTTLTGIKMTELLWKSGIPQNVFQVVVGGPEAGNDLLDLPLEAFFFTGSYRTGKRIAEKVGSRLVPIGMELGGKDPFYVTDDISSVKEVALAAVEGAFYNNGQSCCAVERIYIHEKVYDQFLPFFLEGVTALKVGNPLETGVTQGPLSRKVQVDFLRQQVEEAVKKGARVVAGGGKGIGERGAFFEPTVLVNVNHSMSLMKEESFGPVIGLQKVKNDEEALGLMADTEYGLTASVYCRDISRAEKILSDLNVGTGYVNCCDRVSPYLPWAGRKHSGVGQTLSYLGMLSFVRPKAFHIKWKI